MDYRSSGIPIPIPNLAGINADEMIDEWLTQI
jgi:hypothetical protein